MALLPPFFLNTVLAIGVGDDPTNRRWIGTGFLYGNKVTTNQDDSHYQLFVITNKHVLATHRHVYIKFNSATESGSTDYRLSLFDDENRPQFSSHEGADVAAKWVNGRALQSENRDFSFVQSDTHVLAKEDMKTAGVSEGDRVFVLGFPMGMVAAERQYAICRTGVFARVRDYLEDRTTDYLVDASVFPGNSGGPVINCPSGMAIQGTKEIRSANLVGMVKESVSYTDRAASLQTGRVRVTFEDNSGLAIVEGVHVIVETIELEEQRVRAARQQRESDATENTSAEARIRQPLRAPHAKATTKSPS